ERVVRPERPFRAPPIGRTRQASFPSELVPSQEESHRKGRPDIARELFSDRGAGGGARRGQFRLAGRGKGKGGGVAGRTGRRGKPPGRMWKASSAAQVRVGPVQGDRVRMAAASQSLVRSLGRPTRAGGGLVPPDERSIRSRIRADPAAKVAVVHPGRHHRLAWL